MPDYLYRCEGGHEWDRTERMLYGTAVVCPTCGSPAWRKPTRLGVNWGGLRPSQGELSKPVRDWVDNIPESRDHLAAMKEYHVNATEDE